MEHFLLLLCVLGVSTMVVVLRNNFLKILTALCANVPLLLDWCESGITAYVLYPFFPSRKRVSVLKYKRAKATLKVPDRQIPKGRKGKGYIAIPAYKGDLNEQENGACNQTSPIWRTSAREGKERKENKCKKHVT
eukprot:1151337-Pelagomonas_calceolata.AAC.7